MGRIAIWARPGSSRDYLDWDPWRRRWVVGCRAPALGGAANATILSLMARWLGTSTSRVRWVTSGRSPAKVLEVEGVSAPELSHRLELATRGSRVDSRSPPARSDPEP